MKLHILCAAIVLLGAFALPYSSWAYSVTNKTATDLGNGTALFTITYKFGFLNREVYMPILASRNKDFDEKGTNAGYSILLDGKTEGKGTSKLMTSDDAQATLNYTVLPGKAKAIILSSAEIKDGRYYLPKGKSSEFTLVAVVDMSNSPSKEDVSLSITALPFTMIDNGKKIDARLNPSELQYYRTAELNLKN